MKEYEFAEEINASKIVCSCFRCGKPTIIRLHPGEFCFDVTYSVQCDNCSMEEKKYFIENILLSAARMTYNAILSSKKDRRG